MLDGNDKNITDNSNMTLRNSYLFILDPVLGPFLFVHLELLYCCAQVIDSGVFTFVFYGQYLHPFQGGDHFRHEARYCIGTVGIYQCFELTSNVLSNVVDVDYRQGALVVVLHFHSANEV